MIAPTAPAAAAFCCLIAKVQPPRLTRAILPVKAPAAKSPGSQPLVPSASTGATATGAVTPPSGEFAVYVIRWIGTSRPLAPFTVSFSSMVSTKTKSNSLRVTL